MGYRALTDLGFSFLSTQLSCLVLDSTAALERSLIVTPDVDILEIMAPRDIDQVRGTMLLQGQPE